MFEENWWEGSKSVAALCPEQYESAKGRIHVCLLAFEEFLLL